MFTYSFPANTFNDVDAGDKLTYSTLLSNGSSLPEWLNFNNTTRTFSGTPPAKDTIEIVVKATDLGLFCVADIFKLFISQHTGVQVLTEDEFFVYPNPVRGNSLNINCGKIIKKR